MIKARPIKDGSGALIAVELLKDDKRIAYGEFDGECAWVIPMIEMAIREERMRIIDVEQRTRTKRSATAAECERQIRGDQ